MPASIFDASNDFTWDESPNELMHDVAQYNRFIKQMLMMKRESLPSGMVEILRVAIRDASTIRNILENKLQNM